MPRETYVLLIQADTLLAEQAFSARPGLPRLCTVENGDKALRFLRRQEPYAGAPRPDLLLLDLSVPADGGREVLRAVKSDPDLQRIPVIALTTSGSSREIEEIYELHANCCVDKPSTLDEFIKLVQAAQNFWFHIVTLPPH